MPSSRPLLRCVLAAAVLAAGASAHAQDEDDTSAQADVARATSDYGLRLSARLANQGGARNLALAAQLRAMSTGDRAAPGRGAPEGDAPSQAMPEDAQVTAWQRAAASARDRDLLTDLLLLGADGDVRRAAATRWANAEPDNAAPLFFQDLSADALLAAMRGRQRFDMHYLEEVRWIATAYAANPPNDHETTAMNANGDADDRVDSAFSVSAAMGLWVATTLPRFTGLIAACRGDALQQTPTRGDDCRHAGDVLGDASDTAIGRGIGRSIQEYAAADDGARQAARENRRRLAWQMSQLSEAVFAQPDRGVAQMLRLFRDTSIHTEIDLFGRVLAEAKRPLEPPADWQPPQRPGR